jgi:heat shock protein HslJ
VTSFQVGDQRIPLPTGDTPPTVIEFDTAGGWEARLCNRKSGTYRLHGTTVEISMNTSTLAECRHGLDKLDAAANDALTPEPFTYSIAETGLTLQRDDIHIHLERISD